MICSIYSTALSVNIHAIVPYPLLQVTNQIVDVILKRSDAGKDYGIILLSEGLIELIFQ